MLSRHRLADMSSDKLVLCEQGLVSHRALSLLVCQCNSDNVGELRGCFGGAQLKTIVVGNQTVHKEAGGRLEGRLEAGWRQGVS